MSNAGRGGARRNCAQEIDFSSVVHALQNNIDALGRARALDFGVYNGLPEQKAASGPGLLFNVHLLESLCTCQPTATLKASVLHEALVQACTTRAQGPPLAVQALVSATGSVRSACGAVEKRIRVMLCHLRRLKDGVRWRQCVRTMLPADRDALSRLLKLVVFDQEQQQKCIVSSECTTISSECTAISSECTAISSECTPVSSKRGKLCARASDESAVSVDENGWPMMTTRALCARTQEHELLKKALDHEPVPVKKKEVRLQATEAKAACKQTAELAKADVQPKRKKQKQKSVRKDAKTACKQKAPEPPEDLQDLHTLPSLPGLAHSLIVTYLQET